MNKTTRRLNKLNKERIKENKIINDRKLVKRNILLSILICFAFGLFIVGAVTITQITPSGNITTSNSSVEIEFNVSVEDALSNMTWNWDGTNYSLYDDSLVLFMNFDNRSELGENDTYVADLSKYGNNGTVVGGSNITWTPNGKYGGAYNFSGGVNYINAGTMSSIDFTKNWSLSLWFNKISNGNYELIGFNKDGSNKMWDIKINSGGTITYAEFNSSGSIGEVTSTLTINSYNAIYNNFIIVNDYSINKTYFYFNNNLFYNSTINLNGGIGKVGTPQLIIGSYRGTSNFFNGSIDEVMIFNRSLSVNEISQLYKSQLTKYDINNWTFKTNQTLNSTVNSTTKTYNWNYKLCSSNSTDELCSNNYKITQIIPEKNLVANFTNSVGNVRNDFYGATAWNTYLANGSYVAYNSTYNYNLLSNYTFMRESVLNAKLGNYRNIIPLSHLSVSEGVWNNTKGIDAGNIDVIKEQVKWAFEKNITLILSLADMPTWLANQTSGWCNSSKSIYSDSKQWSTCLPNNYTKYGNLIVNFTNYINNNGEYNNIIIEIWNEPNGNDTWLNNLSETNINRSIEYNKLLNTSLIAMYNYNPSIKVIAPATHIYEEANRIIWQNVMGNFSNIVLYPNLYFSFHYISTYYDGDNILNTIFNNCSFYNFNCSLIFNDEWKHKNITEQNITSNWNKWSNNLALQKYYYLQYPANLSNGFYSWSGKRFEPSSAPLLAVIEPQFQNSYLFGTYYLPPYNITKSFATLCPAGGTVYQSFSDDDTIKLVSCKKGEMRNIIIINTDTESKNVSINLTGSTIKTLTNYLNKTQTFVNDSTGIAQLGIMDSYQEGGVNNILYLGEDLQTPTITITSPTNSTYNVNNFYFNVTLDEEGSWCGYSIDGASNVTMDKEGVVYKFSYNVSSISEGGRNVVFSCNDTSNNYAFNNVSFNLDLTNPVSTLLNPENNTYSNSSSNNFSSSLTDNQGLANATLYIYNSTDLVNQTTVTFATHPISWTWGLIVSLADGIYKWFVKVFDFSGNSDLSENYTITIDTTFPDINFTNPTPSNNTNQSNNNIYVNYSTNDTNSIYSLINFDSSLVGWYRFEGNANDELGKNNGTVIGATQINNSIFGKGYDFNITTQINISNSDSLNISKSITLSAWVKIHNYTSYSRIVAKSPLTNVYPYTIYGLLTDTNVTGIKKVRMELASNGIQHVIRSTTGINEDEWFLITGTHDQETNITRLYLNGVLDNSSLFNSSIAGSEVMANISGIDTNNLPVTIGRASYSERGLNGSIDEVLILNRSLSSEEVQALYNSTKTYHNFTNLADGNHTFKSYVIDQAGNKNQTETRSLMSDSSPPIITGISPTSGNDEDGIVDFYFNTTDLSSIDNCTLYLRDVEVMGGESKQYFISSVNKSIQNLYRDSNIIRTNMLQWYLNCSDYFGQNSVSPTYQIDTETGGNGGGSSGGNGGGSAVIIKNISSNICNETYEFALENPKNYEHISEIVSKYSSENYTSIKSYIDNWQNYCSDLINKTLYPKVVCKNIYDLLNKTNGNLSDKNISSLKSTIDKLIPISKRLLIFYIENYDELCYKNEYSTEFKQEVYFYLENKCNPLLPSLLDASIDFLYLDISNSKCSTITFLNNFFEIGGYNEQYRLVGVRIYVLVLLAGIILGLRFLFKKKKEK